MNLIEFDHLNEKATNAVINTTLTGGDKFQAGSLKNFLAQKMA